MRVRTIGSNKTEVEKWNGTFLVSYETVVAALLHNGKGWVRTNEFFSNTTSKHINHWLYVKNNADNVEQVSQEFLQGMFDAR